MFRYKQYLVLTEVVNRKSAWYIVYWLLAGLVGAVLVTAAGAQPVALPPAELITARQGLPQAFVPAIVQDRQGFIWMATRDGLARYDGYTFRVFQPSTDGYPSLSSPGLTTLTLAPDGYLWIQNDQFGLDGFDPRHETFLNLSTQPAYRRLFGRDTLLTIYPDAHRHLWLTFRRQGLARYDLDTKQVVQFLHRADQPHSIASNAVNTITEDGRGQLWVATDRGLDRFDPTTNQFIHLGYPGAVPGQPAGPIRRLYRRPAGDLWLCTDRHLIRWHPVTGQTQRYALPHLNEQAGWPNQITFDSQGNDYISTGRQLFRYSPGRGLQPLTTPGESVQYVSLFVDQSDVLWAGTDLAGVQKFNLRTAAFQNHPYQRSFVADWLTDYAGVPTARIPAALAGTNAYNFRSTIDPQGQLWFAVGGTPLYRLDSATRQLTTVPGPATLHDYKLERPTLLSTDPDGRVWVVHPDWSGYFRADQNRWVRFPHAFQPAVRSAMLQAVVDRQALWIATASTGLYRIDRGNGQVRRYQPQYADSTSLSSNNLYWLTADPLDTNQLWIGTFGSGLCRFDKRTGRCQRITTRQGLPNNVVYAAIPDQSGSVWLATNQGLGQLDRATGRIRVYRQEDGLGADEFNRFHAVTMPDRGTANGRIVLGTIAGLVGFAPRAVRPDTFQPRVQVSAILVNNRPLAADSLLYLDGSGGLAELILPHNQNFLTVRFAAMQYNRLGQATYRYQLAGLSAGWVVTSQPEAIFTALPPGQYQLRIQAANTGGQWSRHVRQLTILIHPPWWQSGWAYLVYGLLTVGLLWAYNRFRTRQIQQRQQRMTQQREATQLRQLDELKTRFFANITHELRTPLALILGPAQHLQTRIQDPDDQHWLAMIDRQAHQLLSLTNQLLNLSRLEAGVVRVNEQPGDLAAFVAQVVDSLRPEADRKGLTLNLTNDLPASRYWFDAEKLERVTLNLLTNALKFTPQGSIQVWLRDGVELVVADSGPGLSPTEQERVFDRYYQATPTAASSPGSGIGLALVSELVTLQGGTVRVESPWTTAHSGTRFVVDLPYRLVSTDEPAVPTDNQPVDHYPAEPPTDSRPDERPLVLVVEDNADLRAFISQAVALFGRVLTADDGQAGWEMALASGPDLIISDVLMPRMDGFSLCRRLKDDPRTSHMPVLLLTARTTLDDRMQGLDGGADAYLTKPIHPGELQLRVRNLLATQRRLVEKIRVDLQAPVAPDETIHPFLTTLYQMLEQHLDNAAFGAEELSAQAGMSRMQLYRKLKSLTGLAATDFIRSYRLKRAVGLLQQGQSVAQTAYAVGFESPSYFGQCFREQFGEPPSRFAGKFSQ